MRRLTSTLCCSLLLLGSFACSSEGSGGSATGGSGGSSGSGATKRGSCRQAGKGTALGSMFDGTEDYYILTEEALQEGLTNPDPENLACLVRFDVARAGEGQPGCVDLDNVACEWSQQVTFSNPTIVIDVDGACARSEVEWTETWADGIDGSMVSYGYVDEYEGHTSVVMRWQSEAMGWQVFGPGHWDETTGELGYEAIIGPCRY